MKKVKRIGIYFITLFILLIFSGCSSQNVERTEYHSGLFSGVQELKLQTNSGHSEKQLPYQISMTAGSIKLSLLDSQGATLGYHHMDFGFLQNGIGEFRLSEPTEDIYTLCLEGYAMNLQVVLEQDEFLLDDNSGQDNIR